MNSVEDSLKTTVEDVNEDILVFSTNISLNERFADSQPSTLVLNNGYTATYKNNQPKRRVVFGYRPSVKINNRFSSYSSGNVGQKRNNKSNNKRKEQLCNVAKRRRVVLMPKKADYDNSMEPSLDMDGDEEANIITSTPKKSMTGRVNRRGNSVRRHFNKLYWSNAVEPSRLGDTNSAQTSSDQNRCKEPIIFSPYHYIAGKHRKSLYSWNRSHVNEENMRNRRQSISKEGLDSEIDAYMAEARLITPVSPTDDNVIDPFVQEYKMEIDNCGNMN